MKISRRQWYTSIAALIVIGALMYALRRGRLQSDATRVTRGSLRETVDEDGRTRIKERYVVSAPLSGQMRRIDLHPGDPVTAGRTLVATIEPSEPELLDPRTRAQFDARVRAAETQVELAARRVERMRAANELAQAEFDRAVTLDKQQALSRQEFDRAREAARAATEELKSAEYARQISAFELEQVRAAMSRTSPNSCRENGAWELHITSPVHGRVLRVFQEDAAVVLPGARLIEVGDPADLEAEIDVLSSDAVRIQPGARVFFEHWGGDAPLEGRVRVIEPAGFLKISALGVEEQRVNVIVDIVTPADTRLALGDAFRVDARIVVWEAESVLKLPIGALFRSRGEWAVFAARNGRAQLTTVKIGHSSGRETEILSGLVAGDEVVIHASDKVADGVAIQLRTRR